MSRDDPQFKLRMPAQLRSQAEQSAKAAGRSLNAELVARLESSYLAENLSEGIIPAARARELALMARSGIPDEIRKRVIAGISRAVTLGHSEALVTLSDLELDYGIPEDELDGLMQEITRELSDAGYGFNWDDVTALWIKF